MKRQQVVVEGSNKASVARRENWLWQAETSGVIR